jgi:hypothetical protein
MRLIGDEITRNALKLAQFRKYRYKRDVWPLDKGCHDRNISSNCMVGKLA